MQKGDNRIELVNDEGVWLMEPKANSPDRVLIKAGSAVLKMDEKTKIRYWDTFDKDGNDHARLSPLQPLVIPVEKLELGTTIEIHIPVEKT